MDEAVIQLQWKRVLATRQPSSIPGGSVHLTLRPGDRVLLDSVLPEAATTCWSSVGFEARYGAPPHGENQRNSRTIVADGAGATNKPAAESRNGMEAAQRLRTRNTQSAATRPLYDGDVWFIRTLPGRPDESRHVRYRLDQDGAQFTLPPFAVDTPAGSAMVALTGSLMVGNASDGAPTLKVTIRRTVTPAAGASFQAGFSTSGTVQSMPRRGEVVSFEMPPIKIGGADLPDRFSLRVRMTPLE